MHLIPGLRALAPIAWAMHHGNTMHGYEPGSWRDADPEKFRSSLARHFFAYLDDPDSRTEDTDDLHLACVAVNALFLLWHKHKD